MFSEKPIFMIALCGAIIAQTFAPSRLEAATEPPCRITPAKVHHHLFLMFLTAPPGTKDPSWSLQSVTASEYDSCQACISAAKAVARSISKTPTINISGFCFPVDVTWTAPETREFKPNATEQERANTFPETMQKSLHQLPTSAPIDFNSLSKTR